MRSRVALSVAAVLALGLALPLAPLYAQDGDKKEDKKEVTYASLTEDLQKQEGLFNLYRNEKDGKLMMSITDDQLDKPFLYFSMSTDGVLEAGHFRGSYHNEKIIEFRRYYDRVDIIQKPIGYVFDEDSALSRASDANLSTSVLASLKIKHEEDGRLLFEVDDLFLGEGLHKVSPYSRPGSEGFSVGSLNKGQSRIVAERLYPNNVDVVVNYVFHNPNPSFGASGAIADARSTSITLQHSFIELPDNDFEPRRDDPRIGYFGSQYNNMTTADWAPWNDLINRWHLVKKDPQAELSDPVEPIVFYLENTTPVEWRDVITEGVLGWNKAFEKAGFTNALEVRIQPDDANWDAGDLRYNVIRWTSSPRPPFGGYGPSLANPLTGQILGADIMLEYVYMTNRWIEGINFDANQQGSEHNNALYCSQGYRLHDNLMSGAVMSGLLGQEDINNNELLRQGLIHLVLHEVGHTLGLNHNMKASNLWDHKEVHDKNLTKGVLTGSVMDYAPVNIAPVGTAQGDYYQYEVGPYDEWAIEYGYSTAVANAEQEEQRLEAIASRSGDPALAFGNDADDMRAPGVHIDPQVMIDDLSSNPALYARDRLELINHSFTGLLEKARVPGQSHQQVHTLVRSLVRTYAVQAGVISRQIGGVYVDRTYVGEASQQANSQPYTPVPAEKQREAMQILADYVFTPALFDDLKPVLAYAQPQRRGFSHYGSNEDPKLHQWVIQVQSNVLNQLLHPATLLRIIDSTAYGNQYELHAVLSDLTDAIFPKDATTERARNLQVEYIKRLLAIASVEKDSGYDYVSRAAAYAQLERIHAFRAPRKSQHELTAHHNYLRHLIEKEFSF